MDLDSRHHLFSIPVCLAFGAFMSPQHITHERAPHLHLLRRQAHHTRIHRHHRYCTFATCLLFRFLRSARRSVDLYHSHPRGFHILLDFVISSRPFPISSGVSRSSYLALPYLGYLLILGPGLQFFLAVLTVHFLRLFLSLILIWDGMEECLRCNVYVWCCIVR